MQVKNSVHHLESVAFDVFDKRFNTSWDALMSQVPACRMHTHTHTHARPIPWKRAPVRSADQVDVCVCAHVDPSARVWVHRSAHFAVCFSPQFNAAIIEIEDNTKVFINTSFKKLRSAEGAFDMLLNFKKIKSRDSINKQARIALTTYPARPGRNFQCGTVGVAHADDGEVFRHRVAILPRGGDGDRHLRDEQVRAGGLYGTV
jgi:hypothetical protein